MNYSDKDSEKYGYVEDDEWKEAKQIAVCVINFNKVIMQKLSDALLNHAVDKPVEANPRVEAMRNIVVDIVLIMMDDDLDIDIT